jgi:uroporphyrinogen decarboxylase
VRKGGGRRPEGVGGAPRGWAAAGSVGRVTDSLPPFLAACRGQAVAYTPVWFMRQAGRSLPEYRALRGPGSILEAVRQPELAAELTLQPVRRYGVDAAILFSDIVVPLTGFGVDVAPGTGPVVERPFTARADLDRLRPEPTPYVEETVRLLVKELRVPLIGFAGGPFTLASYLVEGGPSRDFARAKALMWGEPGLWADLVGRLADIALASLRAQVTAGASALQVFESWGGALSPADYQRYVLPALSRLIGGLASLGVPRVVFGVGSGELLSLFAGTGAEVVGVDWRVPLDAARRRVGPGPALQGNLDPAACLAPWPVLADQARAVLALAGPGGHIFNLGHGVLPATDPAQLARLVDLVHTGTA